jgi:hypothetical protein
MFNQDGEQDINSYGTADFALVNPQNYSDHSTCNLLKLEE